MPLHSGVKFLRKHDRNRHNAGAEVLTCEEWYVPISITDHH